MMSFHAISGGRRRLDFPVLHVKSHASESGGAQWKNFGGVQIYVSTLRPDMSTSVRCLRFVSRDETISFNATNVLFSG